MIILDIPGKPIPFKAPSFGSRRTFNPRFAEADQVKYEIKKQYDTIQLLHCPCDISFIFYFEVPKSFSRKKRELALSGKLNHTSRPDRGNCLKFYEDCLIGTVIIDDSLIVSGPVEKQYSTHSHTLIKITPIHNDEIT